MGNMISRTKLFIKRSIPNSLLPPLGRYENRVYFINLAIKSISASTYLEIGVRDGYTFRSIRCKNKFAVDVERSQEFIRLGKGESFFHKESDRFFLEDAPELFGQDKIDVVFIDGLHEFRQSLRDFLNAEFYLARRGLIFLHDCNPATREITTMRGGGDWSGDVWKVVHFLLTYRADLTLFTLNCDLGIGVAMHAKNDYGLAFYQKMANEIDSFKELDYRVLHADRGKIVNLKTPELGRSLIKRLTSEILYR